MARYPTHYHAACNATINGGQRARDVVARSARLYRRAGDRDGAREIVRHCHWIGLDLNWTARERNR